MYVLMYRLLFAMDLFLCCRGRFQTCPPKGPLRGYFGSVEECHSSVIPAPAFAGVNSCRDPSVLSPFVRGSWRG